MSGWAGERQFLNGHVPPVVARLQPAGRLPASTRLELAIGLPLRNQEALTNLLQQIYDPASTNFHHYLTPQQFTEEFGPTEKDYETLMSFAKSNGFTITDTHPSRTLLDVNLSVADIERVFHVSMRLYPHPTEARTFYAPDVEPSLDVETPVLTVSGLNNFKLPHSNLKTIPAEPMSGAKPNVGSGPSGSYLGADFRAAYAPGVMLTGAGQAVGLLQFDGFFMSDIIAYEQQAGLPNVPITTNLLNGYDGTPSPCCVGNGPIEVALDIEMAISMAPGLSHVYVYEGHVANTLLQRMADDNLAKQLSSSWDINGDATTEGIFKQFAAHGQSFFMASGDIGAYTQTGGGHDDPYITVVGGTVLNTAVTNGPWSSETTWSGSSGGISTTYAIPQWQQSVNMSSNHGSTTMRNIPDVAMVAAGVYVIAWNGHIYPGQGGTSVAAPLWAGFTALVNQQAAAHGKPPVGFLNPAFYDIASGPGYSSAFHDITTGNNTNSSNPNRFFAVAGYDLCTGWGTPNGQYLIDALEGYAGPVWVDFNTSFLFPTGSYDSPYGSMGGTTLNPLGGAVNHVSSRGAILIKTAGTSRETFLPLIIKRPLAIKAIGGAAHIGN